MFICAANTLDTISPPLLRRSPIGVRSFICLVTTTRSYTLRSGPSSPSKSRKTGFQRHTFKLTEYALLQAVTHYTQEAVVRSVEPTVGGIVRYNAVEWAAYVDK